MTYKVTGIVVRQVNVGDYDKILTILTPEKGKISGIAKGIRRLHSKKAAACDLFVYSKFALAEGKNLDIVIESELVDSFEDLKDSLFKTSGLFYLAELIDRSIEGEDVDQKDTIFRLVMDFLNIAEASDEESIASQLRAFEAQFLKLLGLFPLLDRCINCDDEIDQQKKYFVDLINGGVLCNKCSSETYSSGTEIGLGSFKTLRYYEQNNLQRSSQVTLQQDQRSEISTVFRGIIEGIHDIRLKSSPVI